MKKMLIISGLDPSSGAGLIQDISVATAMGVSIYSTVSAFTVQTLTKSLSVRFRDTNEILEEIKYFDDVGIIKVGIANPEIIEKLRDIYKDTIIVWNPVLQSSNGLKFLDENIVKNYIKLSDFVVVNSEEAEKIGKFDNMIITGGHLEGEYIKITYKGKEFYHERLNGNFRGTGCVFTTLFSCLVLKGYPAEEAIKEAGNIILKVLKRSSQRVEVEKLSSDWIKYETLDELNKIMLDIMEIGRYTIPEVGQNVSYAIMGAKNEEEVAKFPGRIRLVNDKPYFIGKATFEGKSHTARMTIEMMKKFPYMRCTTNVRYEEDYIENAKRYGLKVYELKREKEPEEFKNIEGQSLKWGINSIIENLDTPPDVIYDKGFWGKEAMIRVFARNPQEVIKKVRLIIGINS
ncbi:phosphomethylpyrimidine kinase [Thermosipho africanus Ob7]|uniref:thiamine-phosphate synthase family protein n=1 Tax=Thermosipho TaxID=2420 RepID=UPI000E0C1B3E|nr:MULTISPECIES: thiamine-phosphate synthase family protein [Thermosipho]MBZ4650777.1 phosphomethylpyrimidine kinase family [Thermosipho sp. (in: thermotogales)]RDI92001.1 phosphomethylpyrimidine kinase [Thermosipho africanus Ob7]